MNKKISIFVFVVFVIFSILFLMKNFVFSVSPFATQSPVVPFETSLTGEYGCIPHKKTSGPQTLECALGVKTVEGDYYSIDTSQLSQEFVMSLQVGQKIIVSGHVVPVEMLSTDHWQKYNLKGIIQAETLGVL